MGECVISLIVFRRRGQSRTSTAARKKLSGISCRSITREMRSERNGYVVIDCIRKRSGQMRTSTGTTPKTSCFTPGEIMWNSTRFWTGPSGTADARRRDEVDVGHRRGAATKTMRALADSPLRAAAPRPAGVVARSSHTAPAIARRSRLASGPGGRQQNVKLFLREPLAEAWGFRFAPEVEDHDSLVLQGAVETPARRSRQNVKLFLREP